MISAVKTILSFAVALTLSLGALNAVYSRSATWNLNPINNDWNTSNNWTPAIVPNTPRDTATFGVSQTTSITQSTDIRLDGMLFNPAASVYTISLTGSINISGAGIVNNSGATQNITCDVANNGNFGVINFLKTATSGESMNYTVNGGPFSDFIGGDIWFWDQSSAGSGVFTTNGGLRSGASGGGIHFLDEATAAHGMFIVEGGAAGATGSVISFGANSSLTESSVVVNGGFFDYGSGLFAYGTTVPLVDVSVTTNGGTAADEFGGSSELDSPGAQGCTFTSNGGVASNASGGVIEFSGTFVTGDSVLIANAGTNGGNGGVLLLLDSAVVGGRVELFGNGTLDLSQHEAPGASVGSVEGDGIVIMGSLNLTLGSNSLSTIFSGTLEEGAGSSLTKVGTGTLALSGPNTYTGGTTIEAGTLLAQTKNASATGTGPVQVNAGTLGGRGKMSGAVTIGSGTGTGAFLAPGVNGAAGLTTQSSLTFNADGTYSCEIDTSRVKADKITGKGVTINSGAMFSLSALGNQTLAPGTVFTVINNRSASPITGTFSNLPDGSIVTINRNNFQASYSGGDGNDLTLTVVP